MSLHLPRLWALVVTLLYGRFNYKHAPGLAVVLNDSEGMLQQH
jgi:hypothetical protein